MRKFIAIFLLLSACNPMTPEKLHAKDVASCSGYGFKQGTKDFSSCMMTLDQNRKIQSIQEQQAAAMNAQASGALLSGISSMQPRGTNCTTMQNGAMGNINCH